MEDKRNYNIYLGFLMAAALGVAVFFIVDMQKVLDPLIAGIFIGMVVRLLLGSRDSLNPGFELAPKVCIPVGIIFYGVNLQFYKMGAIPLTTWLQIFFGVIIVFWVAVYLGKNFLESRAIIFLIAVGTAICGVSAIALAAPVVKSKPEETGIALLVITFWGFLGMLVYPYLQVFLHMSVENYSLLCATTLHQAGFVKTAAMHLGDFCLERAMLLKTVRIGLIIPAMVFVSWIVNQKEIKMKGRISVPWFLWAFLMVGAVFFFIPMLHAYVPLAKTVGKFFWVIAMTGLGLTVDIRKVFVNMKRPLLFGLIVWLAVVFNFFLGYYGMGY